MNFVAYDTTDGTVDTSSGTFPSKKGINTGAGAVQQTLMGTRQVDTFDDRVTYEANIQTTTPQAPSRRIGQDLPGVYRLLFRQQVDPVDGGNKPSRTPVDGVLPSRAAQEYLDEPTYRPWAGLPLSYRSDEEALAHTNDAYPILTDDPQPFDQKWPIDGRYYLTERAPGIPDRFARMPSSQPAVRAWDTVLGSWPWTGEKSAQRPPVASQPFNDQQGLRHDVPSPTGAGGPVTMNNDVSPRPLTFRTAPSPWDVGTDGTYVDSGV